MLGFGFLQILNQKKLIQQLHQIINFNEKQVILSYIEDKLDGGIQDREFKQIFSKLFDLKEDINLNLVQENLRNKLKNSNLSNKQISKSLNFNQITSLINKFSVDQQTEPNDLKIEEYPKIEEESSKEYQDQNRVSDQNRISNETVKRKSDFELDLSVQFDP